MCILVKTYACDAQEHIVDTNCNTPECHRAVPSDVILEKCPLCANANNPETQDGSHASAQPTPPKAEQDQQTASAAIPFPTTAPIVTSVGTMVGEALRKFIRESRMWNIEDYNLTADVIATTEPEAETETETRQATSPKRQVAVSEPFNNNDAESRALTTTANNQLTEAWQTLPTNNDQTQSITSNLAQLDLDVVSNIPIPPASKTMSIGTSFLGDPERDQPQKTLARSRGFMPGTYPADAE